MHARRVGAAHGVRARAASRACGAAWLAERAAVSAVARARGARIRAERAATRRRDALAVPRIAAASVVAFGARTTRLARATARLARAVADELRPRALRAAATLRR